MAFVNAYKGKESVKAGSPDAAQRNPGWSRAGDPDIAALLGWRTSRDGRRPIYSLVFRLFLGWGEPFEPLEQLLLGHAIARNLCIVGVHGASAGADERRCFRLRFVNFDVFLQ